MGHKIKRKVFLLRFAEGSDLDGATVKVRSIPFGQFTAMIGLAGSAAQAINEEATAAQIMGAIDPEDVAQMGRLLTGFGKALVEWDLEEEDGTPIPATPEGVAGLDTDVAFEIIEPWLEAIQGVRQGSPLQSGSGSGTTSPEPSLPMEPLSPSLAS